MASSSAAERTHHSAVLRRTSSKIRATRQKTWRLLSDIASMPLWAPGVTAVDVQEDGRKKGVGAVRRVVFDDGKAVEEHVTAWDAGRGFTYVATEGLPLRAYVASIVISELGSEGRVRITWESYMNSEMMTRQEFDVFYGGWYLIQI